MDIALKGVPFNRALKHLWSYARGSQKASKDVSHGTVCPESSDPFYVVIYYIKWVTTS